MEEIRRLVKKLEKLRMTAGAEQRKEAEHLAADIQEQAGLIRVKIRGLLNRQ